MWKEIKKIITIELLSWAMSVCPDGKFKNKLMLFVVENIDEL
jgi:hypothetical protein